eukprot:evm.model.scf_800.1 EVM.evm.TU.scf_800.1   scf_800:13560-14482(-)
MPRGRLPIPATGCYALQLWVLTAIAVVLPSAAGRDGYMRGSGQSCGQPGTPPWDCQADLPPSERWIYAEAGQFREVNGIRMHYVDIGGDTPGAADRVYVFLHGQPTWAYLWRNVIKVVGGCRAADYPGLKDPCDGPDLPGVARAIAFDHVGFGRSDKPPVEFDASGETAFDYSISRHVDQMEALLDGLKLGKENGGPEIVLVAHDWGGGIAVGYLGRRPGNVAGYVCFECYILEIPLPELGNADSAVFAAQQGEDPFFQGAGFPKFADLFRTVQSYRSIFRDNLFMRFILPAFVVPGNLSDAEFEFY